MSGRLTEYVLAPRPEGARVRHQCGDRRRNRPGPPGNVVAPITSYDRRFLQTYRLQRESGRSYDTAVCESRAALLAGPVRHLQRS